MQVLLLTGDTYISTNVTRAQNAEHKCDPVIVHNTTAEGAFHIYLILEIISRYDKGWLFVNLKNSQNPLK